MFFLMIVLIVIFLNFLGNLTKNKLQQNFIKIGDFNGKHYDEFVRKCGTPTVKQDGKESNLCTWAKGRYLIMLEFDKNGIFLSKKQEVLLKR